MLDATLVLGGIIVGMCAAILAALWLLVWALDALWQWWRRRHPR